MKTSVLPLYAKLKETLIAAIASGELQPGDKLPSHHELCERYNMSYMTMRRAITELTNEGVMTAVHGKGIYVAERKQIAENSGLLSFSEDMKRRGLQSSSRLLEAKIISASTVMAQVLNTQVGEPLVYLQRLRLAGNQPIAIQTAYLPQKICPNLLDHDWNEVSLYTVLQDVYNLMITDSKGTVGAVLATAEEAKLLKKKQPLALLSTERIVYHIDGSPIEFARSLYCADRYQLPLQE